MPKITIELPLKRLVDAQLAADIEKQFTYVSPRLVSLRVAEDGKTILAECGASGTELDEIVGKLTRFLDAITRNFRRIEQRVLFERQRHPVRAGSITIHDAFRARGWMFEHGQGQVSLSGPPLRVLETLDRRLAEIYARDFDAIDQRYPAMIKAELLARCGYFEMHPNIVSFVSHLVEDYDALDAFRRAKQQRDGLVRIPASNLPRRRRGRDVQRWVLERLAENASQFRQNLRLGHEGCRQSW